MAAASDYHLEDQMAVRLPLLTRHRTVIGVRERCGICARVPPGLVPDERSRWR